MGGCSEGQENHESEGNCMNEVVKRAIAGVLGDKAATGYVTMSERSGTVSMKAADLERVVTRAVKLAEEARTEENMKAYAAQVASEEEAAADEDAAAAELARGL